jgi:hypothetical protein
VCVCVCVCMKESARARERARKREREHARARMLGASKMSGHYTDGSEYFPHSTSPDRNILIPDLSNVRGTKCARCSSARRSRGGDDEFVLTAHGRVEWPAPVALC